MTKLGVRRKKRSVSDRKRKQSNSVSFETLEPRQLLALTYEIAPVVDWAGTGEADTGLVANWRLTESSGDATDSTGHGYTLTESGGVASYDGIQGGAREFEGNDSSNSDWFSISPTVPSGDDNPFSIVTHGNSVFGWFRWEDLGTNGTGEDARDENYKVLAAKSETSSAYQSGDEWVLVAMHESITSSGEPTIALMNYDPVNDTQQVVSDDSVDFTDDEWHFVAAGYDDATDKTWVSIDGGAKVWSSSTTNNPTEGSTDFSLGAHSGTTGAFYEKNTYTAYSGQLDEWGLYKGMLSDDQIDYLYNMQTVNSTDDDNTSNTAAGEVTLRSAIEDANAATGIETEIRFDIDTSDSGHSGGIWTIDPASALPTISESVIVAANTQPAYAGSPVIELDGTSTTSVDGFKVTADEVAIRGFTINNFDKAGIFLSTSDDNEIQGNYIGTNTAGTAAEKNGESGIRVEGSDNVIGVSDDNGGTEDEEGNLISGNGDHGIYIVSGTGNVVAGNYIGTNAAGTAYIDNEDDAILVESNSNRIGTDGDGEDDDLERNVIVDHLEYNVHIDGGDSNTVAGNYIGTNAAGTAALGYSDAGVYLVGGASSNIIGTDGSGANDANERNILSGGNLVGVHISGTGSELNQVAGNYIGTDKNGTSAVGNAFYGIRTNLGAEDNIIGTDGDGSNDANERNVISGNVTYGLSLESDSNVVAGNYIGTNAAGTAALKNLWSGIYVSGSSNVIGVTDDSSGGEANEGNLISGNGDHGIHMFSGTGNVVAGNYIGTDAAGTSYIDNEDDALLIESNSNRIGTDGDGNSDADERNVIVDHLEYNVHIDGGDSNTVAGNYIGTNAAGTAALGLSDAGVYLVGGASSNIIGTDGSGANDANERNILSGGNLIGVQISGTGSDSNEVAGNYIGTNAAGTAALGNLFYGVQTTAGAEDNIIGTDGDNSNDANERNIISGNTIYGVALASDSNVVAGNYIGTNTAGTAALKNLWSGIYVTGSDNVIGVTDDSSGGEANEGNLISGNGDHGIHIFTGTGNVVAGNYIGTNAAGTSYIDNEDDALLIESNSNRIGTDGDGNSDADERNVIVDHLEYNVHIDGGDSNTVAGNYIGTNAAGTAALGLSDAGVYLVGGASSNIIGTDGSGTNDANERNLISGGNLIGVQISGSGSDSNEVAGNYIGTNAAGTGAVANTFYGVEITSDAENNLIGTDGDNSNDANERNVISGNAIYGVSLRSDSNTVAGNYIGANAAGTGALGNGWSGVYVTGADNVIGVSDDSSGGEANEGNVIAANGDHGVHLFGTAADDNIVAGNTIGGSSASLGNDDHGVMIESGDSNEIGGTSDDLANTIWYNGADGVYVKSGTNNSILRNSIFANTDFGIDLDSGANDDLAAPVITLDSTSAGTLTLDFAITGAAANSDYRIEVFGNSEDDTDGEVFLGFATITTDGSGNGSVTIDVSDGYDFYSSTATEDLGSGDYGSTSEFSDNYDNT